MAKKKPDFRVWIDGELHAPLSQLAKEHASTVPRQANRILWERLITKVSPQANLINQDYQALLARRREMEVLFQSQQRQAATK